MDSLTALRQTFFQECEEQLGELELGLVAMDEGDTGSETVNAVFRAVHSIKGGAGAFKLERLVKFAHTFETTLDMIRSERLVATNAVLKTMLRSSDALADLVKAARTGEELDESRTAPLLVELKDFTESAQADPISGAPPAAEAESLDFQPVTFSFDAVPGGDLAIGSTRYAIAFAPSDELYRGGNDATRLLRELGRLGELVVTCDASALPTLDKLDPERAYLKWQVELATEESVDAIRDVFEFVSGLCELSIEPIVAESEPPAAESVAQPEPSPEAAPEAAPPPAAAPAPSSEKAKPEVVKTESAPTIRVDLERIDRLINLVGELVINQAMLTQCVSEAGVRSSSVTGALDALEQLTREIQEGVMAVRAQPVKPLFQRMARIVRELADTTGKSVRLRTDGEATEVDRTVIERLADPLTHMIRNAVDHGLESPEKRLAAGKPDQGEVHLLAAHRSGRVVIEVSDDGAGINRPKVQQIAVSKGLIPADSVLTDSEVDNLLFLPGFSTASAISNISGRGRRHGCRQALHPGAGRPNRHLLAARPRFDVLDEPAADAGRARRHGRESRGPDARGSPDGDRRNAASEGRRHPRSRRRRAGHLGSRRLRSADRRRPRTRLPARQRQSARWHRHGRGD